MKKDDAEVWRWSRDKAFTGAFTTLELHPGQQRSFQTAWGQWTVDSGPWTVDRGQ
ncbi:hypothetical protein HYR99_21295 [Candidatus Poribacteria bacterium]|nr:hypothetical protein [Candidatus Poribacteria bacterium]